MTNTQKQNRRRLIKALRSGQYSQGTGGLRSSEGYCCQGVACDLSGIGTWIQDDEGEYHYDDHFLYWPIAVRESLGIDLPTAQELVRMNDGGALPLNAPTDRYTLGEQCTFEEIADCMELLTLAGL